MAPRATDPVALAADLIRCRHQRLSELLSRKRGPGIAQHRSCGIRVQNRLQGAARRQAIAAIVNGN